MFSSQDTCWQEIPQVVQWLIQQCTRKWCRWDSVHLSWDLITTKTDLNDSKVLKQGWKFPSLVRGKWNSKTLIKFGEIRIDLMPVCTNFGLDLRHNLHLNSYWKSAPKTWFDLVINSTKKDTRQRRLELGNYGLNLVNLRTLRLQNWLGLFGLI